jgi:arginyl-tRNA synthetase
VLEKPKAGNADEWEPREQMLFRSTDFGDDVDRAVKKSDGSWTYFASDIAYHLDKLNRGSDTLINIWGADHGGYVKRMKSAVSAFTGNKDSLNIQLVQLVKLMDGGQQVKMSKRAGTFVTLSDVLDAVGRDILRFIMLTRRADQTMDFDYAEGHNTIP